MSGEVVDVGGAPAVGNVLGFSLLLRDRKALLRLDRRPIGPGIALADYEAEIPDVSFPLRAPFSAAAFRNRRCRAVRLRLTVENRTLQVWLDRHLRGTRLASMRVDEARIELEGRPDPTLPPCPCLHLEGRDDRGRFVWLLIALQIVPIDRHLTVRPIRKWLIGTTETDADAVWHALVERLDEHADDGEIRMDPTRNALLRPFVESGWKVPDLSQLKVVALGVSDRELDLALEEAHSDSTAAAVPARVAVRVTDPVFSELTRLRRDLLDPTPEAANPSDAFERLLELVAHHGPTRRAALRWMAECTRWVDRTRCLSAVRRWLRLSPNDARARRMLIEVLGADGSMQSLLAALQAARQLAPDPRGGARLDLALAILRLDKLGDEAGARDLLQPLAAQLSTAPGLSALAGQAWLMLARARARAQPGPRAAAEALDAFSRGIETVDAGPGRALVRLDMASALTQPHGTDAPDADRVEAATRLVREAIEDVGDDSELLEHAIELASGCGAHALVTDLLRARLSTMAPDAVEGRAQLHRRIIESLRAAGSSGREAAIAEIEQVVGDDAAASDLLELAAAIESEAGRLISAADYLERYLRVASDAGDRSRATIERARLLLHAGDAAAAWTSLRPFADGELPVNERALELLLRAAPIDALAAMRPLWQERMSTDSVSLLLMERAHEVHEPEARRRLLAEAAAAASDPRHALRALAAASDDDDLDALRHLAEACARHDDRPGELAALVELGARALAVDPEQAAVAFERAMERSPSEPTLAIAFASCLVRLDRRSDAADVLEPLVDREHELGPLAEDPRLEIERTPGWIAWRAGRLRAESDDPDRAVGLLESALRAAPPEAPFQRSCTLALAEAVLRTGQRERAAEVYAAMADTMPGVDGARWLLRAARLVDPAKRVRWLERAAELLPDDIAVIEALIAALRAAGEDARAAALLHRHAKATTLPVERRIEVLRRLIALRRADRRRSTGSDEAILAAAHEDPELVDLSGDLLELDPDDIDALLLVAQHDLARGRIGEAARKWRRVLEQLTDDDVRLETPALALARFALDDERPEEARPLLDRVLALAPRHVEAVGLLARVGVALNDPPLLLRAKEIRLEILDEGDGTIPGEPGERARLLLELSRIHHAMGDVAAALQRIAMARAEVELGSPLHLEVAQAWLTLARDRKTEPEHEAAARAELRRAVGADLPPEELRAEAMLWADRLGDPDKAIALLEQGLRERPTHELLLSSLKQSCFDPELDGSPSDTAPYIAALERAVAATVDPQRLDSLLVELATTATELQDAEIAMNALDRLSPELAASAEMLDLRDWAVHRLGREDHEMQTIADRLLASPADDTLASRFERIVGNPVHTVEKLLALAAEAEGEAAGLLAARAVTVGARIDELSLLVRAMRRAMESGAISVVSQAWADAEARARAQEDETAIADLVAVGDAAGLNERAQGLLDSGLAQMPAAPHLHRLLWTTACVEAGDGALERALARIDHIAEAHELPVADRVALLGGVADQLDRRRASALLSERARAAAGEDELFAGLLEALQERGHFPEVRRLLEHVAMTAAEPSGRVQASKRLAHLCAETLDDPDAAIEHLQRALEWAPTDPDLLLPLLDHCFVRRDLMRAIELTLRVLDHVPMGDAAFAALAHRAADAAVAQSEPGRAMEILRKAKARLPDDPRTQSRLDELVEMTNDPAQRVAMLRSVADRQGGLARHEALEERARLLVDPLDRLDEAVTDLETVVSEAPDRATSVELLERLYARTARWHDLVVLLEGQFPRQHGVKRCETLRRIASIHSEHLFDLPRCEQALRLALDHIGTDAQHRDLAEDIRRRLVAALEAQGRFVDLSIYLERALEPEIEGNLAPEDLHPDREALLVELARIYRDALDDEGKAARIYERLERLGRLPDEGLAPLARWYHRQRRHEDLVRILMLRARALGEAGSIGRKAAVDQRIGELLEGPLGRPHEAATYYLDAYLANPSANAGAGARARVLLSGTDAVANVRKRLLDRLPDLPLSHRPALLTLLGDILAPHEEYEAESEARYTEALALDAGHAAAREALGRLLARQGRLEAAIDPLVEASRHRDIPPERAAEDAAIAARALLELGQPNVAERVLKDALRRAPDSQRALLELARLYERLQRTTEQAIVLENLAQLPLSSMLRAEVSYRRAMLLAPAFTADHLSPEAERARAHLLEAVSADAKHVAARQVLLELATTRLEWSIVAHMHYLAIRDLPPGPTRAQIHLDLAETYLMHIGDTDSALRNIESAIAQAPSDVVVATRSAKLATRMPDPRRAAERFEDIASGDADLDDASRARLWLLSAELRMHDDDPAAAEAASKRVLELSEAPGDVTAAASRNLETLANDDARELRQQKSGLLRLLETEEQATERLHILDRLREIGRALGDDGLVDWASREQLGLVDAIDEADADLGSTGDALRDVFAQRGAYAEVVMLYEKLAKRATTPERAAPLLAEAARFCWHGLRDARQAVGLLRQALGQDHGLETALVLLGEITQTVDDPELAADLHDELRKLQATTTDHEATSRRPPAVELQIAHLALRLGRHEEALGLLRRLSSSEDPGIARQALAHLDVVLTRIGQPSDRLAVLRRCLEAAREHDPEDVPAFALELARVQAAIGDGDGALRSCAIGLETDPEHQPLLALSVQLLEQREAWPALTSSLERLAALTGDPEEQAQLLTRAARVRLDHETTANDPQLRQTAVREARRLLVAACELAPHSRIPRSVLLPLAFSEGRWDEVLEIAGPFRRSASDDEESLILAALAEAYRLGERGLAREIGYRHGIDAQQRYLYPGLRQLLTQVAAQGPLPRLDALLAAGAALSGGRGPLAEGLRSWAAGRPVQAGLALGLARLAEADGEAELARSLYQIASFMAPDGPVPALADRLPLPMPPDDIDAAAVGPMERPSVLRVLLTRLREALAGIPEHSALLEPPPNEIIHTRLTLADTIVEPWRRHLGLRLPIAWSRTPFPGNVGVRNARHPTIVLGPGAEQTSLPELRFRLAAATGVIGMGLAIVFDPAGYDLGDVLDAVCQIANPGHEPTGMSAQYIADTLATAGHTAASIEHEERTRLMEELAHWLTAPAGVTQLHGELRRARILFATRLSGQLDGALQSLALDMGLVRDGRADAVATLRTEEATWLLRALGLY
jgi:tetratricopeptide (TPR) repeat protein/Tfp pilus assembly protein PilF